MSDLKKTVETIDKVLNDTLMMTNDINSFLFLRSEGYRYLERYKLGGGNFLSLLGLVSMLSFLGKTYFVLKKGHSFQKKQKLRNELLGLFKSRTIPGKYKQLIRNIDPKEVNETESFVSLMKDYPNDIGLQEKTDQELRNVWNDIRNKLVHINRPAANNCAVTRNFLERSYSEAKDDMPKSPVFDFTEDRESVRRKMITNLSRSVSLDEQSAIDVVSFSSDLIYVDQFNSELPKIKNWIMSELNEGIFKQDNVTALISWYKECKIT